MAEKTLVSEQRKKGLERHEGGCALRVTWRKERKVGKRKTIPARYLVQCGCCDEKLEILCMLPEGVEVNGVMGSVENWREILLPLLGIKQTKEGLVDLRSPKTKAVATLKRLRRKYGKVGKVALKNRRKKGNAPPPLPSNLEMYDMPIE